VLVKLFLFTLMIIGHSLMLNKMNLLLELNLILLRLIQRAEIRPRPLLLQQLFRALIIKQQLPLITSQVMVRV
jgi:hypothetical protein